MEELEDDPSSEMLAIELYRPAVYAARTFDLLYVGYRRYRTVGRYRRYPLCAVAVTRVFGALAPRGWMH